MPNDEMIEIYRAANAPQAAMIGSLLENAGISPTWDGESVNVLTGELPIGGPRILVRVEDEAAARKVIADFEAGEYVIDPDDQSIDFLDDEFDWPDCPQCNEPREAHCKSCGYTGFDFECTPLYKVSVPEHESRSEAEKPTMMLTCPICDVEFGLLFINICSHCSYRFEDGIDLQNEAAFTRPESAGMNFPIIAVAIALLILIIAGIAYFLQL